MKKILWPLLLVLCLALAGCNQTTVNSSGMPESTPASSAQEKMAVLYTNLSGGSESPDIKQHEWEYSGDLTAEKLAEGLSQLTGLDFNISVSQAKDGISVDWKANSTLIANLDDREQKEEFHVFDADSMRWFMMDSLWMTLTNNLKVENVYYTMDGGKDLSFEELNPVKTFPRDLPYMGAAFFYAHADGKGELEEGRGDLIDEKGNVVESRSDQGAMTQVRAEDAVWDLMTEDQKISLRLIGDGEETIGGEHAFLVTAGNRSADGQKFTALYHLAVTDSGVIYRMDPVEGPEWKKLEKGEGLQ